ncbi:MAG: glycosyltransferase family 9 protein [Myxococcota bacterium]
MTVHHTDCRHFRGDRPCDFRRPCEGCGDYSPMGLRILVIKLAATGDVLRTTPILPAIKREHPRSHVTWLTRPESLELLQGLEEIDRALALDADSVAYLPAERFDVVMCLDKEPAATGLAARLDAPDKRGFVLGPHGNPLPAGPAADYAYRLGLDDELKFRTNQRTYQDITFEMVGLGWDHQDYRLEIPRRARDRAAARWKRLGVGPDERVVGLNVGAGEAFAHKDWRVEGWALLVRLVETRLGARVALLGGPDDRERVEAVASLAGPTALDPGATPSILEFAALLERCAAVVTGDTLAMHLALARRRPVVALFGSTCPQEVELYGRGEKIVPKIDCHPCYRSQCSLQPSCADAIPAETVLGAVSRVLRAPR